MKMLTQNRKPYVTELDLRHSLIPEDLIEDLIHTMPKHHGPDLQEDRHLPKYDYIEFMENMAQGGGKAAANSKENDHVNGNHSPSRR